MVAMAKKAWFALMNWKTRMGSLRSPVRTRPLPLPRCRAPGAVADSHAADGSAPRARRWSGRPVGGHHRDRPVVPNSKSPGRSVRTRATAPPVFAQFGPDPPSVAGIPAHRVGDSSALMAPPSQVERCPPNRVNPKHPHVHCLVTGGGLSDAGRRWHPAEKNFLFPTKALGKLVRTCFRDAFSKLRLDIS